MKSCLLLAALTSCGLCQADEAVAASDRFLGANGTMLRDRRGQGDTALLRGANLGSWLKWEAWMGPIDSSKTLKEVNPGHNGYAFQVRRLLTTRFGPATAHELITAYKNKASGSNSWSALTTINGKAPPIPDLSKDSAEEIRNKWKAWVTNDQNFAFNPMLKPVLTPAKP
jgi:hypothetical protein